MRARRSVRVGLSCATLVTGLTAVPAAAQAASSCTYDAATHTVLFTSSALSASIGAFGFVPPPYPIVASAPDLPFGTCGGATVDNTDTIDVVESGPASSNFAVDMSTAPLAPGFTREPGQRSEIEVDLSGLGNQLLIYALPGGGGRYTFGDEAAAWNSDGDADILYPAALNPNLTTLEVGVLGPNSVVSARGGHGTGGPVTFHHLLQGAGAGDTIYGSDQADDVILTNPAGTTARVFGFGGDDQLSAGGPFAMGTAILRGGQGNDVIFGGPGVDRLYGGPGNDQLFAADGQADTIVNGGTGSDVATVDCGLDPLAHVESTICGPAGLAPPSRLPSTPAQPAFAIR